MTDPAVWLGLAAGVGVILGFVYLSRRRRAPGQLAPTAPIVADWEGPAMLARHDERRRSIRRGGVPTPLHVIDARGGRRNTPQAAYVLDRSTGGVRLAVEKPYAIGSTLNARPTNAPDDFPWVPMIVRNCREAEDYFELGCQFESELELNKLLMFG